MSGPGYAHRRPAKELRRAPPIQEEFLTLGRKSAPAMSQTIPAGKLKPNMRNIPALTIRSRNIAIDHQVWHEDR
jgi:hypothetical protein